MILPDFPLIQVIGVGSTDSDPRCARSSQEASRLLADGSLD